jgi:hypothetical protein
MSKYKSIFSSYNKPELNYVVVQDKYIFNLLIHISATNTFKNYTNISAIEVETKRAITKTTKVTLDYGFADVNHQFKQLIVSPDGKYLVFISNTNHLACYTLSCDGNEINMVSNYNYPVLSSSDNGNKIDSQLKCHFIQNSDQFNIIYTNKLPNGQLELAINQFSNETGFIRKYIIAIQSLIDIGLKTEFINRLVATGNDYHTCTSFITPDIIIATTIPDIHNATWKHASELIRREFRFKLINLKAINESAANTGSGVVCSEVYPFNGLDNMESGMLSNELFAAYKSILVADNSNNTCNPVFVHSSDNNTVYYIMPTSGHTYGIYKLKLFNLKRPNNIGNEIGFSGNPDRIGREYNIYSDPFDLKIMRVCNMGTIMYLVSMPNSANFSVYSVALSDNSVKKYELCLVTAKGNYDIAPSISNVYEIPNDIALSRDSLEATTYDKYKNRIKLIDFTNKLDIVVISVHDTIYYFKTEINTLNIELDNTKLPDIFADIDVDLPNEVLLNIAAVASKPCSSIKFNDDISAVNRRPVSIRKYEIYDYMVIPKPSSGQISKLYDNLYKPTREPANNKANKKTPDPPKYNPLAFNNGDGIAPTMLPADLLPKRTRITPNSITDISNKQ